MRRRPRFSRSPSPRPRDLSFSPSPPPSAARRAPRSPANGKPDKTALALLLLGSLGALTGASGAQLLLLAAVVALVAHADSARGRAQLERRLGALVCGGAALLALVVLVLFAGAYLLIVTPPFEGYLQHGAASREQNATLCHDSNLMTASYWNATGAFPHAHVVPRGYVAGCTTWANCSRGDVVMSDEPYPFGAEGSVAILRTDEDRMHPRRFTLVFRGTSTPEEWTDESDAAATQFYSPVRTTGMGAEGKAGHSAAGWVGEFGLVNAPLLARLFEELAPGEAPSALTVTVLGHSLGTGVAALFALEAHALGIHVRRVTLASPVRVFTGALQAQYAAQLQDRTTIMFSSLDDVANTPPAQLGYHLVPARETIVVLYPERCMHCLNTMWLRPPGAKLSCSEICDAATNAPRTQQMVVYKEAVIGQWLDQWAAFLPRLLMGIRDNAGMWQRHHSTTFAELLCPTVGEEVLRWPTTSS